MIFQHNIIPCTFFFHVNLYWMWNIKEFKNASILLTVLITGYISTKTYGLCLKASFIKCAIYFSTTKTAIKCIFKEIKILLLCKLFPVKSYILLVYYLANLTNKIYYLSQWPLNFSGTLATTIFEINEIKIQYKYCSYTK